MHPKSVGKGNVRVTEDDARASSNEPREEPWLAEIVGTMDSSTRRAFLKRLAEAGAGVGLAGVGWSGAAFAQESTSSPNALAIQDGQRSKVSLRVNGHEYWREVDVRTTLLDFLRETLGLTGSKKGCDHGQCGACTVLVDGSRLNSCLVLAASLDGASVTTVEGLARDGELHPLQVAFIRHDAFQCGYCTPGQLCSGVACLKEGRASTDAEVATWMSGNICRCGAYPNLVAAIREVQESSTSAK